MPLFKQLYQTFKKLILVWATCMPVIEAGKKDNMALARVLFIHNPLYFCKYKKNKV